MRPLLPLLLLLLGCSEYTVRHEEEIPPPVEAPGAGDADDFGEAPDWTSCPSGYLGHYYNLPATHPDLEPPEDAPTIEDPGQLDWWDERYLSFQRFDASLEQGGGWWPVDEGLEGDPGWFSARWTAWMRVEAATPVELVLGASSDVFVLVNGEPVASQVGRSELAPEVLTLELRTGQFPIEIRYAHRMGESGIRLRFASEHVRVCYPDFEE